MILMMHLLMMMIIIIIMMMWGNTVDCDENECDSFMNSISTHTHTHTLCFYKIKYTADSTCKECTTPYGFVWKQSTGQSQFFHIVPIKMAISMVLWCAMPHFKKAQPYHHWFKNSPSINCSMVLELAASSPSFRDWVTTVTTQPPTGDIKRYHLDTTFKKSHETTTGHDQVRKIILQSQ